MKARIIFTLLVFAIIIAPLTANPTLADTTIGPVPVPGNLLIPGTSVPVTPTTPNLGTVSVAPLLGSIYSINKAQSGLVVADPLNNKTETQQQLQADHKYWVYGGDAPARNAPYTISEDPQGFHIGVQAQTDGAWAGYYAESPNTNAMLFHSVVTTPVRLLPVLAVPQWYENGMYVQTLVTPQSSVNYVTCTSGTSQWGTAWAVIAATGNANGATSFTRLWLDNSTNQALTRDCTIITNGSNFLKVYMDGVMVFNSNTMNLQMPGPFNTYLEPQSSYSGQMLTGTFTDYYATTDENVKVTNNPTLAATVDLVDPTGKVLATSPVVSGNAAFTIGQFHMPLAAYIKIYDSHGIQLASTSSPVNIFGGDVYQVSSLLGL
jgi:hypothetical protein